MCRRALLERDLQSPYTPTQEVEQVWRDIYADAERSIELQQSRRDAGRHRRGLLQLEVSASDGYAPDLRRAAGVLRHRGRRVACTDDARRFRSRNSGRRAPSSADPPAVCPHMKRQDQ